MKQNIKLSFALLAGVAIGAIAVPGLRAQTPPPAPPSAYVVAETHVTNPAGFTEYMRREAATLTLYHGRVVARGLPDVREGTPADGAVTIYAFDTPKDANQWYDSAEYASLKSLRQISAKSRVYFLFGIVSQ
jgi:uncharacterized protein (DUF1330 family)